MENNTNVRRSKLRNKKMNSKTILKSWLLFHCFECFHRLIEPIT